MFIVLSSAEETEVFNYLLETEEKNRPVAFEATVYDSEEKAKDCLYSIANCVSEDSETSDVKWSQDGKTVTVRKDGTVIWFGQVVGI